MNEDTKFTCSTCHIAVPDKEDKAMTACRLCGRLHCPDCVDEYGRCVDCNSEDSPAGGQD